MRGLDRGGLGFIVPGLDRGTISIVPRTPFAAVDWDRPNRPPRNTIGRIASWLRSLNQRPRKDQGEESEAATGKVKKKPAASNDKPAKTSSASTKGSPARRKSADGEESSGNGTGPALVIVESPKKAKSINKFLGSKVYRQGQHGALCATCRSGSSAWT